MLLNIGDKIQQGVYHVHSRFNRVVNMTNGNCLVSLVEEEIGGGPLNIVFKNIVLEEVHGIKIEQQSVVLDSRRFDFERDQFYHSGMDFEHVNPKIFQTNLTILEKQLIQLSPAKSLVFLLDKNRIHNFRQGFEQTFVNRITNAVQMIFEGELVNGVKLLKGCGFGLTPSGDDFIAGLLVGLNLIQKISGREYSGTIKMIYEISKGENIFSNTFLYLAQKGWLLERIKNLIAALLYSGEGEIFRCTERLISIGESSGADLITGFYLAVKNDRYGFNIYSEGSNRN